LRTEKQTSAFAIFILMPLGVGKWLNAGLESGDKYKSIDSATDGVLILLLNKT
jgi:hypothetical protein